MLSTATTATMTMLVVVVLMLATALAVLVPMAMLVPMMMVMMITVRMGVAVIEFVLAGGAHGEHFDIEDEILARQRMISVERHLITFNSNHRDNRRLAVAIGLEHVADIERFHRQAIARNLSDQLRIAFSVRLLGRNHDHALGSRRQPSQGLFQAIDDLACTFKIQNRFAADGGVQQLPLLVTKCVVKGNDGTGHGSCGAGQMGSDDLPDCPPSRQLSGERHSPSAPEQARCHPTRPRRPGGRPTCIPSRCARAST